MKVPNRFPTLPSSLRIALVGEAPGRDEAAMGEPFVGASGRFLASILARVGTSRESCFLGNVCQVQPPANDIAAFAWDGPEIQEGLAQLREDLQKLRPNIVVCLGNTPLKAAKDVNGTGKKPAFSLKAWRGSLFKPTDPASPMFGIKTIASYHPAYVLRDYEAYPLLRFDLLKAVKNSQTPDLVLPNRLMEVRLSCPEILERIEKVRRDRTLVALDIEGGVSGVSCISFATSPLHAFIVPFYRKDGSPCWTEAEEFQLWRATAMLLEDPTVPKVLQNSLYDRFVLHWAYGVRILGVVEDTMLKGWEMYSELPKGLGTQASIYTDEPYYKGDIKSQDDTTFYEYCCRDSAVTLEICQKQAQYLKGSALTHYKLNVELLNPLLYMELRGIRYATDEAKSRRAVLQRKMFEAQATLNGMTGHRFKWENMNEILLRRIELMRYVKDTTKTKAAYSEADARLSELLRCSSPDLATIGELEDLCEVSLNLGSPMFKGYLYETLKLPVQYKEARGEDRTVTADYEALLKLSKAAQDEGNDHAFQVVQSAITIRALSTREGMLSIHADRDGRIRCGYNIVATDTGRIGSYESPTGSGYNLQTIPNYTNPAEAPGNILGDRDLFLADEGYWLFQNDLKGADGWTVAAYAAMCGDRTMLDDYLFGLKPANILTLMLRGVTVNFQDREALKQASKKVDKDSWDYFAMKRVQHGASYLEGGLTISRNILKDSEGKLVLKVKECDHMKQCFFTRYPGIRKWHDWVGRQLRAKPELTAASGQVRKFFGRPDEILTKAVAFEPQANTTYVTNLALHRLWHDPENRLKTTCSSNSSHGLCSSLSAQIPVGRENERIYSTFRVEPLHQVHDALIGQFKKGDEAWAIRKLHEWFDNPITIAAQKITIPFDGAYGESWGNLNAGKVSLDAIKSNDDKQFRGM